MIKLCTVTEILNENKKTGNQVMSVIDDEGNSYIAEGNPDYFSVDDKVIYFSKDHAMPIRSFNTCRFDPAAATAKHNDVMVLNQARCVRFVFLYPIEPKKGFEDLESI